MPRTRQRPRVNARPSERRLMTARPFGRLGDNPHGSWTSSTPPFHGADHRRQLGRPDLVARLQIGRRVRLREHERQSEMAEFLHIGPIRNAVAEVVTHTMLFCVIVCAACGR